MRRWALGLAASGLVATACVRTPADGSTQGLGESDATTDAPPTTTGSPSTTGSPEGSTGTSTGGDGTGSTGLPEPKFDLPAADGGMPEVTECKVVDGSESGTATCNIAAPPDAFEPTLQWEFSGRDGDVRALTPPLVANLTDDNDDGEIDLCDTPDVVLVIGPTFPMGGGNEGSGGHIYVIDGATGEEHFRIEDWVQMAATPALGDIDGDGYVEIVTVEPADAPPAGLDTCALVAFEHDGTRKWTGDVVANCQTSAVALANIDNSGDPEIIIGSQVFDSSGAQLFSDSRGAPYSASTAADLDGDGDLEVIFGHGAWHHDGTVYWDKFEDLEPDNWGYFLANHAQVANFDEDPDPEVLIAAHHGIWLYENDGTPIWERYAPTGEFGDWNRPVAIHDFNGDGAAEFALSAEEHFGVFRPDQTELWVADIVDDSGQAGGTAFDFIGSGAAQAIYADETIAYVFDDLGSELMVTARSSLTWIEYPTVADVDNDGSAEFLVGADGGDGYALKVIADQQDRWVPARRIWNQHTYHVTNVREDGTIPVFEEPHWLSLNTFRTQAQIEAGSVCQPEG